MPNEMNNKPTAHSIVHIFEDVVENRMTALEYKVFDNPNMLIWNFLIGKEENITLMIRADPLMSNKDGRNSIEFSDLKIYLVSQNSNNNVGLSNILDLPALTIDKLKPAIRIYFEKHNLMARAEHNDHHVFFSIKN